MASVSGIFDKGFSLVQSRSLPLRANARRSALHTRSSPELKNLEDYAAYNIDSLLSVGRDKKIFSLEINDSGEDPHQNQPTGCTVDTLFYTTIHGPHSFHFENNTPVRFRTSYGAVLPTPTAPHAPLSEDTVYYTYNSQSIYLYLRDVPDGDVITFPNSGGSVPLDGLIEVFRVDDEGDYRPYIYNTNCWASSLDISCISPWNSGNNTLGGGTLISPRHVLFAAHVDSYPVVGDFMHFVSPSGAVTTKKITAMLDHPDYAPFYPDIKIGVLDSDVPDTISFARILPSDYLNYLPEDASGDMYRLEGVPILFTAHSNKDLVWDVHALGEIYGGNYSLRTRIPTDPSRLSFCEDSVTGDSGEPLMLLLDNEMVILSVVTFGTAGDPTDTPPDGYIQGTDIHHFKADINAMMTTLGGGYQLTEIDLTGYETFT